MVENPQQRQWVICVRLCVCASKVRQKAQVTEKFRKRNEKSLVSKKLVNVCVCVWEYKHRRSEDKDTHKRKAACKSFSSSLYFSLSMPATATELIFQFAKRIHWLFVFTFTHTSTSPFTLSPIRPHNQLLAHTHTGKDTDADSTFLLGY